MTSWKCEVHAQGEWVANGLRFETEKEALDWGVDLLSRWFVPDDYRAVKTDEPATHRFNGSTVESLND